MKAKKTNTNTKNTKGEQLTVDVGGENLFAKLVEATAGLAVQHWSQNFSSLRGRSVTLTLRPAGPKIAIVK